MHRALRAVAVALVAGVVVPIATATAVLASFLFLPLPATLPEPRQGVEARISRIFDINGNQIGVFRKFDFTKEITPDDIPEVLKQAVIASEDRRFYSHGGIDIGGTMRALWADIRSGEAVQGGSTITQQLVKNAYVGNERTLVRKVREAVLASQIDRQLDKEDILFKYLDRVYFGEGAYGVGAAAETYFRKDVRDLSLSEAATLAGLIPAPSRYEPRGNLPAAENKRRIVLGAMLETGAITQEEHDEALAQELWLASSGPPPEGRPVTVVHPAERVETNYPYFVDYVSRYLSARYGPDAPYRGLDIYTTLDPGLQQLALQSVQETLAGTAPPLEMALVSLEPGTGFVKAMVGGRDFYAPGGQVNLALGSMGGGLGRQPGSTFKPFVLAAAFEQGVAPSKRYSGRTGICVAPDYCPQNYGNASYGTVDLRTATRKSINTVFVQLMRDVGVEETLELLDELGVAYDHDRFYGLATALGVIEVSPLHMASAYGTFAARGERAAPTPVVTVIEADGTVLEDNTEPEREEVLKQATADNLTDVMRHVFDPGSTASGRGIGRPAAGKTGTTDDSGDAWFVGYTPQFSTAVWMGYRDSRAPMRGIKGVRTVTGGSFPARTWQAFMQRAHVNRPVIDFTEPTPITRVADLAKRRARAGFDVGSRRQVEDTSTGGDYVEEMPPPVVDPPTTTTTTAPEDGGGDDDDPSPFPPPPRDDDDLFD